MSRLSYRFALEQLCAACKLDPHRLAQVVALAEDTWPHLHGTGANQRKVRQRGWYGGRDVALTMGIRLLGSAAAATPLTFEEWRSWKAPDAMSTFEARRDAAERWVQAQAPRWSLPFRRFTAGLAAATCGRRFDMTAVRSLKLHNSKDVVRMASMVDDATAHVNAALERGDASAPSDVNTLTPWWYVFNRYADRAHACSAVLAADSSAELPRLLAVVEGIGLNAPAFAEGAKVARAITDGALHEVIQRALADAGQDQQRDRALLEINLCRLALVLDAELDPDAVGRRAMRLCRMIGHESLAISACRAVAARWLRVADRDPARPGVAARALWWANRGARIAHEQGNNRRQAQIQLQRAEIFLRTGRPGRATDAVQFARAAFAPVAALGVAFQPEIGAGIEEMVSLVSRAR